MPKMITPEVLEEAIEWLGTQGFICHALPAAMSGYEYTSRFCSVEDGMAAWYFLEPLFKMDCISTDGNWVSSVYPHDKLKFTREEWLLKIAQELREGKITRNAGLVENLQ